MALYGVAKGRGSDLICWARKLKQPSIVYILITNDFCCLPTHQGIYTRHILITAIRAKECEYNHRLKLARTMKETNDIKVPVGQEKIK